jgi:hypothetical protein
MGATSNEQKIQQKAEAEGDKLRPRGSTRLYRMAAYVIAELDITDASAWVSSAVSRA